RVHVDLRGGSKRLAILVQTHAVLAPVARDRPARARAAAAAGPRADRAPAAARPRPGSRPRRGATSTPRPRRAAASRAGTGPARARTGARAGRGGLGFGATARPARGVLTRLAIHEQYAARQKGRPKKRSPQVRHLVTPFHE